jgi:serine/threonine protein phosphatase PrpC
LSRSIPDRSVNDIRDLPAVLASDVGQKRHENQDRVAALRVASHRPFAAFALVDGMGGMRDGSRCAVIALANFFQALVVNRAVSAIERLRITTLSPNEAVYSFAHQNGGATLSAVLVDRAEAPALSMSEIAEFSRLQAIEHGS